MPDYQSMRDTNQGYGPGSVLDASEAFVRSVLDDLETGEISSYADQNQRAVSYMVAGGGPSAYVVFLLDDSGEPESATLHYFDMNRGVAPFPDWSISRLYKAFRDAD